MIVRPAAVVALRAETLDYAEAESSPAAAAATHPGGAVPLLRAASSVAVLFVFWVVLSGFFTPFLLGAGLASSIGVVWLVRRMEMVDHEGHPIEFSLRATSYWPWLVKEIAKAAWDVTKIILSPRLPISPRSCASGRRSERSRPRHARELHHADPRHDHRRRGPTSSSCTR